MNWKDLLSRKRFAGDKFFETEGNKARSEFDRDFDRVVFSSAFRRLQDKTQVFPLPESDFIHTRLTHSLEVSCVGRSLGRIAGNVILERYKDIPASANDFGSIVAAACLCHDIGNPPFGHSGEKAISEYFLNGAGIRFKEFVSQKEWNDLTDFEGNAEGFRILTHPHYSGLKLTLSTIAAFTKYPRDSDNAGTDTKRKSQDKYGFFQSEKEIFKRLADEMGLISHGNYRWCRHPLAFLVEAADDICYQIIDLEDGCRLRLMTFKETEELLKDIAKDEYSESSYNAIKDNNERIGYLRAKAINVLVNEAAEVFLEHEKDMLDGTFDSALTSVIPSASSLKTIKGISFDRIYHSKPAVETKIAGFEVLGGLLESFITSVENHYAGLKFEKDRILRVMIPPQYLEGVTSETPVYRRILNILDFTAGMTDTYAVSLYRKIKGIALPK